MPPIDGKSSEIPKFIALTLISSSAINSFMAEPAPPATTLSSSVTSKSE